MEDIDLKTLIRNNPAVNETQFHEAIRTIKSLREHGVGGAEYNLSMPYERRSFEAETKPLSSLRHHR